MSTPGRAPHRPSEQTADRAEWHSIFVVSAAPFVMFAALSFGAIGAGIAIASGFIYAGAIAYPKADPSKAFWVASTIMCAALLVISTT